LDRRHEHCRGSGRPVSASRQATPKLRHRASHLATGNSYSNCSGFYGSGMQAMPGAFWRHASTRYSAERTTRYVSRAGGPAGLESRNASRSVPCFARKMARKPQPCGRVTPGPRLKCGRQRRDPRVCFPAAKCSSPNHRGTMAVSPHDRGVPPLLFCPGRAGFWRRAAE